jgi:hypothetical protein
MYLLLVTNLQPPGKQIQIFLGSNVDDKIVMNFSDDIV